MPELIDMIDREVTLQLLDKSIELFDENTLQDRMSKNGLLAARRIVSKQPTIEAEPVRHGRWIEKPPYADETVKGLEFQIVCSRCDEQNASITFDENSVPIAKTFYRTKFCPNCGADMREEGADNG